MKENFETANKELLHKINTAPSDVDYDFIIDKVNRALYKAYKEYETSIDARKCRYEEKYGPVTFDQAIYDLQIKCGKYLYKQAIVFYMNNANFVLKQKAATIDKFYALVDAYVQVGQYFIGIFDQWYYHALFLLGLTQDDVVVGKLNLPQIQINLNLSKKFYKETPRAVNEIDEKCKTFENEFGRMIVQWSGERPAKTAFSGLNLKINPDNYTWDKSSRSVIPNIWRVFD